MKEYFEKETVLKIICGLNGTNNMVLAESILSIFRRADVAPVEPAHWVLLPEEDYGTADKECSHCHERSLIMSHYCHNCGAHMTGATDA